MKKSRGHVPPKPCLFMLYWLGVWPAKLVRPFIYLEFLGDI